MKSVRLGDLCDIQSGGRPSDQSPTFTEAQFPGRKIGDLETATGKVLATEESITEEGLAAIRGRIFSKGTLLFAIYGSIGKMAFAGTRLSTNQAILGIEIREKTAIDPRYLFRWLGFMNGAFLGDGRGIAQKNLSAAYVRDLRIPLPAFDEQRRIAAILDQADALRRKRSNSLRMIAGLAQAIFVEMFGNPVTNSENWRSAELSEVVVGKYGVKAGPFGSSLKKEEYVSRGYRVYGQEQVIAGRFDIGDYFVDEKKYRQLETCAVSPGDILVSLVGSFGKVLVVPEGIDPGIINPRLLKITPDGNVITSSYLASLLSMPMVQKKLAGDAHGGTMGILNAGILKKLKVILPELESQQEFQKRLAISSQIIHANEFSATYLAALFGTLQNRLLGVDFENTQKRSPSLRAAE